MPADLCWACMILVGRASLFANPIATGTQQGAAGERGIAGAEEEILPLASSMAYFTWLSARRLAA